MLGAARWVTRIGATMPVAAATIVTAGIVAGAPLSGLLMAGVAVGLPGFVIAVSIRAGIIESRFITKQRMRVIFSGLSVVFVLIAALVGAWVAAPRALVLVTLGVAACVAVIGVVSVKFRISAHAVMSAYAAGLAIAAWPWGWLALALPLMVGWSRVILVAHTVSQVASGAVVGVLMSWVISAV